MANKRKSSRKLALWGCKKLHCSFSSSTPTNDDFFFYFSRTIDSVGIFHPKQAFVGESDQQPDFRYSEGGLYKHDSNGPFDIDSQQNFTHR